MFGDAEGTNASFLLATSMAFGLGIAVLVFSIASVSGECSHHSSLALEDICIMLTHACSLLITGGHINPAVTTSLVLIGEMHPVTGVFYVITQFIVSSIFASFDSLSHRYLIPLLLLDCFHDC